MISLLKSFGLEFCFINMKRYVKFACWVFILPLCTTLEYFVYVFLFVEYQLRSTDCNVSCC